MLRSQATASSASNQSLWHSLWWSSKPMMTKKKQ
jgi:hypothetical protein